MDTYLTTTHDAVFVFTTLEVSTVVLWKMVDDPVDAGYREATVEATDEDSYSWPHGSFG